MNQVPSWKAKTNIFVNIDDALDLVRRLRGNGEKLVRRHKGWWVSYYSNGGLLTPLVEIHIDSQRIVPQGSVIKMENDFKPFLPERIVVDFPSEAVMWSPMLRWSGFYGKSPFVDPKP